MPNYNTRNNQEAERKQPDGSLQPVVAGLNMSATKLYRTKADGEENTAHSAIIDYAESQANGSAQVTIKINGAEFIYRAHNVDTNNVTQLQFG